MASFWSPPTRRFTSRTESPNSPVQTRENRPQNNRLLRHGYDRGMRKSWLWLMLVLLPLRLWASTLMPMALPAPAPMAVLAHNPWHEALAPTVTRPIASDHAAEAAPHAHLGHAIDVLNTPLDTRHGAEHAADHGTEPGTHSSHDPAAAMEDPSKAESCHEGPGCSACAVCHLSASMPGTVFHIIGHAVHAVPVQGTFTLHDHAWPPLIKPPIS